MLAPRLRRSLQQLATQHLLRERKINTPSAAIDYRSNDYLQLATHPNVVTAFIQAAHQYGLGSGASAAVSGYTHAHQALEVASADFLQREQAIIFNSGYHANLGVISTLANQHTTIVADKLSHASLIDGFILSRAKLHRYRHNDAAHADDILATSHSLQTLLVSESVFSIRGDIAPVRALVASAKKHRATLIIDDAHGIGVLGNTGGGICDELQLSSQDIPCLISPFGKAIGSFGAVVTGNADFIEAIHQHARTYRYSTALPPAICTATTAALTALKQEPWRRERLRQLIRFFIMSANTRKIPLLSGDITPIKSIPTSDNQAALHLQTTLAASGILVACIRPPTVPTNQACIRLSLNCGHTEAQITQLLDILSEHHDFQKTHNHRF